MRDGFKQLGEHVEDCRAAADEDGIAFIVHDGLDCRRKRNGDRGGSTMWHRFICNDTRCRAVQLVRWDVLAEFVNRRAENLTP